MNTIEIVISKEFSKEPFGRTDKDGQFNGSKFRDRFIIPALKQGKRIVINFDGAEGYGSSFLEESFGGLVRNGFNDTTIHEQITLISNDDPSIIEEVNEYIREEMNRLNR